MGNILIKTAQHQVRYFIIGLIFGVAILIAGFFLAHPQNFKNKLIDLNLLKKPEPFTELYLVNYQDLSKNIGSSREQLFEFGIHNLEYKDMSYAYKVSAFVDDREVLLSQGEVFLRHDESRVLTEKISLALFNSRARIVFELVGMNQAIHFWVEKQE